MTPGERSIVYLRMTFWSSLLRRGARVPRHALLLGGGGTSEILSQHHARAARGVGHEEPRLAHGRDSGSLCAGAAQIAMRRHLPPSEEISRFRDKHANPLCSSYAYRHTSTKRRLLRFPLFRFPSQQLPPQAGGSNQGRNPVHSYPFRVFEIQAHETSRCKNLACLSNMRSQAPQAMHGLSYISPMIGRNGS